MLFWACLLDIKAHLKAKVFLLLGTYLSYQFTPQYTSYISFDFLSTNSHKVINIRAMGLTEVLTVPFNRRENIIRWLVFFWHMLYSIDSQYNGFQISLFIIFPINLCKCFLKKSTHTHKHIHFAKKNVFCLINFVLWQWCCEGYNSSSVCAE